MKPPPLPHKHKRLEQKPVQEPGNHRVQAVAPHLLHDVLNEMVAFREFHNDTRGRKKKAVDEKNIRLMDR